MSFLRNLFGRAKLDGAALAHSTEKVDYAQIELLATFRTPRPAHDPMTQQLWNRVLPRSYADTLALFQKEGWLTVTGALRWRF